MTTTTKRCCRCDEVKPTSEFSKRSNRPAGVISYCKQCESSRMRKYYSDNADSVRRRVARHKAENPERVADGERNYRRRLKGWRVRTWVRLNSRTINGSHPNWKDKGARSYLEKGIRLEISRDEFFKWAEEQWPIAVSIFAAGDRPSIDRIDSRGHYAIDNIRIISLRENCSRPRTPRAA